MDIGLLEILAGLVIVMVGWLHIRQNKLEDEIANKVGKEAFSEVKAGVKEILNSLIEIKVENARWQGLVERVIENKQG